MPTFRLLDIDGADLGAYWTTGRDWTAGDQIRRGPDDALEVVAIVEAGDTDNFAAYVVTKSAE